jgi:hypothetical protein
MQGGLKPVDTVLKVKRQPVRANLHIRSTNGPCLAPGSPLISVMQPTQDRAGYHTLTRCRSNGNGRRIRNALRQALMRPQGIEVVDIGAHEATQMSLPKDQQVIEAFPTHGTDKAFADSIGPERFKGRGDHVNMSTRRDSSEMHPILVVVVADEMFRPLTEGRGLAQLLSRPLVRGMARDADLNHPARTELNDDEHEQRAEEHVGDLDEVARPDGFGLIVEEAQPRLPPGMGRSGLLHILPDSAFADA